MHTRLQQALQTLDNAIHPFIPVSCTRFLALLLLCCILQYAPDTVNSSFLTPGVFHFGMHLIAEVC